MKISLILRVLIGVFGGYWLLVGVIGLVGVWVDGPLMHSRPLGLLCTGLSLCVIGSAFYRYGYKQVLAAGGAVSCGLALGAVKYHDPLMALVTGVCLGGGPCLLSLALKLEHRSRRE